MKGTFVQSKAVHVGAISLTSSAVPGAMRRVLGICAFAGFTAAAAQFAVRLPFTPVPVTLQTLFVALAGIMLGPRDGFIAMIAYLGAGLAGAPVFAGFAFGPWTLVGPTGGYLVAFPAAALVSGAIAGRIGRGRAAVAAATLAGSGVILLAGASYLALLSGLSLGGVVAAGILPFAAGEIAKSAAAACVVPLSE